MMKNILGYLILVSFLLSSFATAATSVRISDHGTDVTNSTNDLVNGNLTILIYYDNETASTPFFNQTHEDGIVNGSWNVVIVADLEYGKEYWKDYEINGENLNYSGIDRLEFHSPLGYINNETFFNFSMISSCSAGESIRQVYENGSVVCEEDTDTRVAGTGYLYNDSTTMSLNETLLNATIDSRTIAGSSNSSTWWAAVSGWVSGWFYKSGNDLAFNETKLNETIALEGVAVGFNSTYNSTYDAHVEDNSSWNESYADTLYAAISVADTDTQKNASGYLYNDSATIYLNETLLNATIDARDSDTTIWTNVSGVATYNGSVNVSNGSVTVEAGDIVVSNGNIISYGPNGATTSFVAGYEAGASLTSGADNVLIGRNAGDELTNGGKSVYIGIDAGSSTNSTSGSQNVGIGEYALADGTYDFGQVTAIGTYAGYDTGGNILMSVMIGFEAGMGSSGTHGVYLGSNAGQNEATDSKLWISNANNDLIEGSFADGWVKVLGDLNATGDLDVTGNMTADYFIGNGSLLTGVVGTQKNASGYLYNDTTTIYLDETLLNATIANEGVAVGFNSTYNASYDTKADYEFGADYFNGSGNFTTSGNVTADYFIGDGSGLTNINKSHSSNWNESSSDLYYDGGDVIISSGNIESYGVGGVYSNFVGGRNAGPVLTTGFDNIIIGKEAGFLLTIGVGNVLIGEHAGDSLIDEFYNTFVGGFAGQSATELNYSVGIGHFALDSAENASNTTSIGAFSGASSSGANGVYIGHYAGRLEDTDDKLWISSGIDNNLIEGSFATGDKWVKILGDFNVTGNVTISANSVLQLNVNTTAVPCSASVNNGSLMYNGVTHLGCNGTGWNALY